MQKTIPLNTVKLIMGGNKKETSIKLHAAIATFNKQGGDLQQFAHRLLCSLLLHVGQHRDTRPLNRFLKEAKENVNMVRVNSMMKWCETFGPLKIEDNKVKYDNSKKLRLGDAMAKPFWKFKAGEGQPYQPITLENIANFVARLERDRTKCAENNIEFDHRKADAIQALKPLVKTGIVCG